MTYPRPLTDRERATLDHLLSANAQGVSKLRQQASSAQVEGMCQCGCASIDLSVDRANAASAPVASRLPIDANSVEREEADSVFDLLLWCDDGWLAGVEIVYYSDTIPTEFPSPIEFEPAKAAS